MQQVNRQSVEATERERQRREGGGAPPGPTTSSKGLVMLAMAIATAAIIMTTVPAQRAHGAHSPMPASDQRERAP